MQQIIHYAPMPPERTGIADYSADLLPHLRQVVDLTIATKQRYSFEKPHLPIYQMGNSPFHNWIYDALKAQPGIVVLHDWVLSQFMGQRADFVREVTYALGAERGRSVLFGETTLTDQGRTDARLRVIFDNGTESNMLMRSLQRALNADGDAGRRITEPNAGPLFSDQTIDGDEASGTIYVLRSKSDHPLVTENRELVHKIGVTNMTVEKRIAGAHLQPTFLMANVDVVATYELYNINRTKLENLIHRIFEPARLEIEIMDRFGRPVVPREWFLVPLFVIKEAVEKIKDGTIRDFVYEPKSASLTRKYSEGDDQ